MPTFTNIVITEDLRASGLTYVPGSTQLQRASASRRRRWCSRVSAGPNDSVLTWTLSSSVRAAGKRPNNGGGQPAGLIIEFEVERDSSVGDEGLVNG